MNDIKTAYILRRDEALFLLTCVPELRPSAPAMHLLTHCLSDCTVSQEAIEGMVYKKLARKDTDKLVLEPVMDLFARSALTSNRLWFFTDMDEDATALILRSADLFLLIRRYPHIPDSWRITPYQNAQTLRDELLGFSIQQLRAIDSQGTESDISPDGHFSWLGED